MALFICFMFRSYSQCASFTPISSPICSNAPFIALDPLVSPGGGTFYGTGVFTGSSLSFFNPFIAGPGTWTIGYTINPSCSVTISVTVADFIQITPTPNFGTKYLLASGGSVSLSVSNPAFYSNFHWYENGFEVGTSSSLTVYRMGTFTVIADGPCGLKEKAELDVVCDCSAGAVDSTTYANGYTFNDVINSYILSGSSTPHTNTDFVFGGTISIQAGTRVYINNANIDMKPCTKIIIQRGDSVYGGGLLSLGTHCTLRGCDKWQGIIVNGDVSQDQTSSIQGKLVIATQDASVSDAYIAVYSNSGGKVELEYGSYSNNNSDVVLMNYPNFNYAPVFQENTFRGSWVHNDIDSLPCTRDTAYTTFDNTPNKSVFKQMIYLENVKDFNINKCTFIGNNFLNDSNFKVNAIELSNLNNIHLEDLSFSNYLNSGIYAQSLTNLLRTGASYSQDRNYIFNTYSFDSSCVLDKAIDLDHCDNIILGYTQASPYTANRFLGTMNYGTFVNSGENIKQYENLFNVNYVTSTAGVGSNISTCFYYKNCGNLFVNSNWTAATSNGGYFENCGDNSTITTNQIYQNNNGAYFKNCPNITIDNNTIDGCAYNALEFYGDGGTKSYIQNNHFLNNDKALIISPDQNPIGTGNTSNDNSSPMNIDISCNLFQNNNYGIIGSGDIIDQGNGSYTNGNKFDNNLYWDLIWMDFDASYFDWFCTPSANSKANTNISLTKPATTLNATSLSTSQAILNDTSSEPVCFSSLFIAQNPKPTISATGKNPKLVNSIAEKEIIISDFYSPSNVKFNCFDVLGRTYDLKYEYSEDGKIKFNIQSLQPGVYFIQNNTTCFRFFKTQR